MVLSRQAIMSEMQRGAIVVNPYFLNHLTPQGYDLHLGRNMYVHTGELTDIKSDISELYNRIVIPDEGLVLEPGRLYLGVTVEYTESHGFIPIMEGTSTNGRMGLETHICAGCGDDGFCGHWTLEIRATVPTRIYAGMPVGQIIWHRVEGSTESDRYGSGKAVSYNNPNQNHQNAWPVLPNLHQKPHKFVI